MVKRMVTVIGGWVGLGSCGMGFWEKGRVERIETAAAQRSCVAWDLWLRGTAREMEVRRLHVERLSDDQFETKG